MFILNSLNGRGYFDQRIPEALINQRNMMGHIIQKRGSQFQKE